MKYRCLCFVFGLAALYSLAQAQVAPHSALASAKTVKQTWTPPRTADGHPDLQGFWANNNATPEDRALQERCITYGSPHMVAGYQSYYQVVQTPKSVVIMTEMIHDARAIPLDAGPHLAPAVQQWFGDSRGHWEGDTLVVDTTN